MTSSVSWSASQTPTPQSESWPGGWWTSCRRTASPRIYNGSLGPATTPGSSRRGVSRAPATYHQPADASLTSSSSSSSSPSVSPSSSLSRLVMFFPPRQRRQRCVSCPLCVAALPSSRCVASSPDSTAGGVLTFDPCMTLLRWGVDWPVSVWGCDEVDRTERRRIICKVFIKRPQKCRQEDLIDGRGIYIAP